MATAAYQVPTKPAKLGLEEEPIRKIRITLSSKQVKNVEKVCSDLIERVKSKTSHLIPIRTKGPVRMPTKTLRITTRKSPCGEGTNTWDRFELRIHKRVLDFYTTPETVKVVTKIDMEPGVMVEVTIGDV